MTSTTAASRLAVLLLVATASLARAQSPASEASELFRQARELYKSGNYADACVKFAKSQDLDPQLGTLFNLAQCDEKIGKLASALAAYREVVAKDGNARRKALAAEYQSHLEPRVPKVVVQVVHPPASLVVTLDGPTGPRPIDANLPIEVDLGDYTVVARADGFRELSTKVKIDTEGETKTVPVTLALVHDEDITTTTKTVTTAPQPAPVASVSHRKRNGKILVGLGGAAVATGVVFGVLAHGKWNDAQAVCGGTLCPTQGQVDQAQGLVGDARTYGNLSTACMIAGGAIAAAGLYLWLTAPSDEHAVRMTATATATSTGISLSGRF